LGWLPAVAVRPLVGIIPTTALWWVLIGGLCYTVGVVCLKCDTKVRYFHALWHLAVVAGTAWHYFAILIFVVPAA
jgi:hemolysin III